MVAFFTPGTPAPQGSKAYKGMRNGKPILVESSKKVKPWRAAVAQVAALHCQGIEDGPVTVRMEFLMPRPKSLPKRIIHHQKKPDLDKLVRSTCDALSGVAYQDDNQVNRLVASKRYVNQDESTGVYLQIERTI